MNLIAYSETLDGLNKLWMSEFNFKGTYCFCCWQHNRCTSHLIPTLECGYNRSATIHRFHKLHEFKYINAYLCPFPKKLFTQVTVS